MKGALGTIVGLFALLGVLALAYLILAHHPAYGSALAASHPANADALPGPAGA